MSAGPEVEVEPVPHGNGTADGSASGDGVGGRLIDDSYAMDMIGQWLNVPEWSADTLDEIASVLLMTGRTITDGDPA